MSGSHKEFPKKAVSIQLGLAALVGVGYLFAEKPAVHAMAEKVEKPIVVAAAKVLAPIGKVEIKEESTASAARSGEEIYTATCGVCHDNGVAGAPKLDDKTSWETRLSGGYAALVTSAINGKGGMPARGGNPDISDSEMELVVSHMIKKAGIDLVARSSNSAPAATTTEAAPKAAETTSIATKVEETTDVVVEKAKEVASTVEETVEEVVAKVEEKVEVVTDVIEEKVEVVTDAVEEKVAVVTDAVEEKVAVVANAVEDKVEAVVSAVKVDHSAGEAVYKSSCFACHDSGVAGSPKIGDKAAWTPRIATGTDSLYEAAIKGKGAMPGKGGNMSIPDADVKAAVDYMVSESM